MLNLKKLKDDFESGMGFKEMDESHGLNKNCIYYLARSNNWNRPIVEQEKITYPLTLLEDAYVLMKRIENDCGSC